MIRNSAFRYLNASVTIQKSLDPSLFGVITLVLVNPTSDVVRFDTFIEYVRSCDSSSESTEYTTGCEKSAVTSPDGMNERSRNNLAPSLSVNSGVSSCRF